jgi:hypothetical protein
VQKETDGEENTKGIKDVFVEKFEERFVMKEGGMKDFVAGSTNPTDPFIPDPYEES